jgi:hypothetical protein
MSEEIQEEPGKYVAVDDEGTIKVDLRVSPDEVQPKSTEEEAVGDTVVDEESREEEGLRLQEEVVGRVFTARNYRRRGSYKT